MSLTALISGKKSQELREEFKTVFPRPKIKLTGEMLAPPLTNNYSEVGQAFDYILRFTLEYRHKEKIKSLCRWAADIAYLTIEKHLEAKKSKIIRVGFRGAIEKDRKEFLSMLKTKYADAKNNYQKYLVDGILTDSLIKSALFLAQLDVTFRTGMIDQNIGNENELNVKDVRQLMTVLNDDHFKVDSHCVINPTFGEGSRLVDGADGDLIIDDTLIDLKVTKSLSVKRDQLNQIIGYYILSLIGGINDDKDFRPIKNIGLYFARHGILWKFPVADLAEEKDILEFKDWFVKYADSKIWNGKFETAKQ